MAADTVGPADCEEKRALAWRVLALHSAGHPVSRPVDTMSLRSLLDSAAAMGVADPLDSSAALLMEQVAAAFDDLKSAAMPTPCVPAAVVGAGSWRHRADIAVERRKAVLTAARLPDTRMVDGLSVRDLVALAKTAASADPLDCPAPQLVERVAGFVERVCRGILAAATHV
jgi:hypothetical protein